MTFEEAIEHLDNVKEAEAKDYTDKFGHFDELAFELKNYRLWAREVHKTIDKLQSTYAPKVKMTKAQFDWFKIAIDLYDELEDVLSYRWETPTVAEVGYNDVVREIRLLEDKTLALAWLHPELIEV